MSAKIAYSPTDSGEPSEVEVFGVKFQAGKVRTVSDDMAIRLMGNPFFERKDKPKDDTSDDSADDGSDTSGADTSTKTQLRTPAQAALGQGDAPKTTGPARPVDPTQDPVPPVTPASGK